MMVLRDYMDLPSTVSTLLLSTDIPTPATELLPQFSLRKQFENVTLLASFQPCVLLLTQLMGQKQCLPPDAQPVFLLETIP
jgi:hypothetical protein